MLNDSFGPNAAREKVVGLLFGGKHKTGESRVFASISSPGLVWEVQM